MTITVFILVIISAGSALCIEKLYGINSKFKIFYSFLFILLYIRIFCYMYIYILSHVYTWSFSLLLNYANDKTQIKI